MDPELCIADQQNDPVISGPWVGNKTPEVCSDRPETDIGLNICDRTSVLYFDFPQGVRVACQGIAKQRNGGSPIQLHLAPFHCLDPFSRRKM